MDDYKPKYKYIDVEGINYYSFKNDSEFMDFKSYISNLSYFDNLYKTIKDKDQREEYLKLNRTNSQETLVRFLFNTKIGKEKVINDFIKDDFRKTISAENYFNSNRKLFNSDKSKKRFQEMDKRYIELKENSISAKIDSVSSYVYAVNAVYSNLTMKNMINEVYNNSPFTNHLIPTTKENILKMEQNTENKILKKLLRNGLFFRGEPEEHKYTIPSIFRSLNYIQNEKDSFNRMLIESPEYFTKGRFTFDKLAMMQHHGLNTRTLDVTSNALVALYFAVSRNDEKDGYVIPFICGKNGNRICTSASDKVSVKSALSQLSYKQKILIANFINGKQNDEILETSKDNIPSSKYLENFSINLDTIKFDTDEAIEALYHSIKMSSQDFSRKIKIGDLKDINFVLPKYTDDRIIRQSGALILSGLSGIADHIYAPEKEVQESIIQIAISNQIMKYVFPYTLNDFLNYSEENTDDALKELEKDMTSVIRIRINHEYKNKILTELSLLGINESTIYPDLDAKADYVNNLFSF